jgi:hypothetical protein
LSEIRQQNENRARAFAVRSSIICAMRKIVFNKRRLVELARLMRCARLDAAMQNRIHGTARKLGFDFRIEWAQHSIDAIDAVCTVVFEQLCSLKAK